MLNIEYQTFKNDPMTNDSAAKLPINKA